MNWLTNLISGVKSLFQKKRVERELDEELGVRVTVSERLCSSEFVYDHGGFRIEAFWVEILSGALTPRVHDLIDWVAPNDLRRYDLLPADQPIADAVVSHFAR